jgi:hypothetical protein
VYQQEGFKNTLCADPNVPGPGTYKNFPSFGHEAKQITLKGRVKELTPSVSTPGPGAYKEWATLPKDGKNFYSKYKSVNSGAIGPPSGSRFQEIGRKHSETPGPGQYSPRTELAKTGQYFLSKFKDAGSPSLYKSKRETMKLAKTDRYGPGPGSYIMPSDFGYPTISKMMNKKNRKHVTRRASMSGRASSMPKSEHQSSNL